MKALHKTLIASAIVLGISASAFAAGPGYGNCGPRAAGSGYGRMDPEQRAAWHQKRMDERRAYLHDQLKLTSKQESAWKEYIAGAGPQFKGQRMNRDELQKLSAPERMEKMHAFKKARDAHFEKRIAATKKFYAVLTPEQQKIFDAQHMGPRQGHFGKGRGGHGRGMGPGMGQASAPAGQ
jgi:Spy/CpxP family protein refolding chaperone